MSPPSTPATTCGRPRAALGAHQPQADRCGSLHSPRTPQAIHQKQYIKELTRSRGARSRKATGCHEQRLQFEAGEGESKDSCLGHNVAQPLTEEEKNKLIQAYGYKAQREAQTPIAAQPSRPPPAASSSSGAAHHNIPVIKRTLKKQDTSGARHGVTRNRMDEFDSWQEERKRNNTGEELGAAENLEMEVMRPVEAPPPWWTAAWGQAEQSIDSYSDQMGGLFSLQSECMTTIEHRLMDQARRSREAYEGIAQRLDQETTAT